MPQHDLERHNQEVTYFGVTNFRNQQKSFGIKTDDRRRHMYIIGKTGMGKSTMLENMIIQDIRRGHGVAVVDPHGDLVEKMLNFIPSHRINEVVYFNPADINYPIAFNILESVDEPHQKNLVASGLVAVFHKLWADTWGPRLEYILRNTILALLDYPGATLLGVPRMLVNKEYRKKVVARIKDPVVRAFWVDEYTKFSNQFQVEAISPIQNKVGQFLSMSMIRNIIGQVKSAIDIREIMDNNKILILNLAKGRMGEDASSLLGATMITKMQLAAMSRIDVFEEERQDFYLYVDEFQNFATESFANILSEARKYKLNLIVAHQYIEQLSEEVRAAVFGNVGTLITFRVGASDAEFLAKEFLPVFNETDLVNLAKYDIYLKLMIDGVTSDPFSATGLPPLAREEGNAEKIIQVSRERYASKREVIEDKIARWSGVMEDVEEKGEEKKARQPFRREQEEEGYESACSNCGKKTITKFKPDGVRPVFCSDCLLLFKQGKLDRSAFVKTAPPQDQKPPLSSGARADHRSVSDASQKPTPSPSTAPASPQPQQKDASGKSQEKKDDKEPEESRLSQAELSLAEALNKTPISFTGKPLTWPQAAPQPAFQEEKPRKKQSQAGALHMEQPHPERPLQPDVPAGEERKARPPRHDPSSSSRSGSIQPGQVVKF